MRIVVLCACLCLVLANHEGEKSSRMIVGGHNAPYGSRPYQVAIYWAARAPWSMCGGTLVHKRWVITAAHCENWGKATVHLGKTDLRDTTADGAELISGTWIIHPNYNDDNSYNDIALINLDRDASVGEKIQTIPLAPSGSDVTEGTSLLVSGWGHTVEDGYDTQERLRQVELLAVSRSDCRLYYSKYQITSSMFCAWSSGKDSCQNDSGGPIVSGYDLKKHVNGVVLQGVVSWGYGCANSFYPGVYTRVSRYCTWIKSVTSGDVNC